MLKPDAAEMKRRRLKRDKELGLVRSEEMVEPDLVAIEPNFRRRFISSGLNVGTQNWHIPPPATFSNKTTQNITRAHTFVSTDTKLPPIQGASFKSSIVGCENSSGSARDLEQFLESKTSNEPSWLSSKGASRINSISRTPRRSSQAKPELQVSKTLIDAEVGREDEGNMPSTIRTDLMAETKRELSILEQTYSRLVLEAERPLLVPDGSHNATAECAALEEQRISKHIAAEERKRIRRCMLRDEWLSHGVEEFGR
jgi:hypothetical protein